MEKFNIIAGSMFLTEAFQLIIVEKCNIQIILYNVTRTFVYAIKSRACNDALLLDFLCEVHSTC